MGMATTTTARTAAGTVTATTGTASRHNARMPRVRLTRRFGPLGTGLMLWDIWRRLPPKQRQWVAGQVRQHGPRLARQALDAQRNRRRR
jgi:hypothetical protein